MGWPTAVASAPQTPRSGASPKSCACGCRARGGVPPDRERLRPATSLGRVDHLHSHAREGVPPDELRLRRATTLLAPRWPSWELGGRRQQPPVSQPLGLCASAPLLTQLPLTTPVEEIRLPETAP